MYINVDEQINSKIILINSNILFYHILLGGGTSIGPQCFPSTDNFKKKKSSMIFHNFYKDKNTNNSFENQ